MYGSTIKHGTARHTQLGGKPKIRKWLIRANKLIMAIVNVQMTKGFIAKNKQKLKKCIYAQKHEREWCSTYDRRRDQNRKVKELKQKNYQDWRKGDHTRNIRIMKSEKAKRREAKRNQTQEDRRTNIAENQQNKR